ncbi:MAG: hypothetical protein LBO62_00140 [Endomicrobium sp.]|jgi:hypothetical protein|nr:hypothetical protein [Endomicrobium sp.]
MKNITLAIDEQSLALGKKYAKKHKISFNALVRKLIIDAAKPKKSKNHFDDFFKLADELKLSSNGQKWTREEIHERR